MIRLYHVPGCIYGEKVRFALDHLGLEWQEANVAPDDRAEVEQLSGQRLAPVIDDHGTIVADSTRILQYLAENHDASLLPTDPRDQGSAALIEDWADEVVVPLCAGLARRTSVPHDDATRARLDECLQMADGVLHDRMYLVGRALSYADLTLFAALASLPEALRDEVVSPYVNLKEWHLSMIDFRTKSLAGRPGYST